jgi:hypothetical protein
MMETLAGKGETPGWEWPPHPLKHHREKIAAAAAMPERNLPMHSSLLVLTWLEMKTCSVEAGAGIGKLVRNGREQSGSPKPKS